MKINLLITLALLAFQTSAHATSCPTSLDGSCGSSENTALCTDAITYAMPDGTFETQCNSKTANTGDTYSDSSCATDSLVGSCMIKGTNGKNATIMRLYAPISMKQVQSICAQAHGTVCQ